MECSVEAMMLTFDLGFLLKSWLLDYPNAGSRVL